LSRRRALDQCSLSVPVGMRLLVVSEPESTASMLLRILGGLAHADGGRFEIAGMTDPSRDGWGRRVAYLGPEPGIHGWMTPREVLELAAGLLGLAPMEAERRVERALAWAGISPAVARRSVGRGGPPLLQRTGFAAALVGDPEVLLLDEPLRAVESAERTRILRLPGRRRTIVMASRYPASEEGLVTHLALLRRGRVAMLGAVADLAAAGLPLSLRGISTLADLRAAARATPAPGVPVPASR
jgi:ABC-type multidrug transport system ATPase subunit